jgi:hypothetical protein
MGWAKSLVRKRKGSGGWEGEKARIIRESARVWGGVIVTRLAVPNSVLRPQGKGRYLPAFSLKEGPAGRWYDDRRCGGSAGWAVDSGQTGTRTRLQRLASACSALSSFALGLQKGEAAPSEEA